MTDRLLAIAVRGLLLAALAAIGHPAWGEDTLSAAFSARVAATGKRGFLYQVERPAAPGPEGEDNPASPLLYLYGTVHVGKSSLFPLNRIAADRLASSTRLALEADPGRQAALMRLIQKLAVYPDGDSLANHIPAELLDRLPAMRDRYRLPMARMLRMRAWMLAQSLDVMELSRAGFTAGEGVEVILAEYANQRQIPIVEIEGFEQQLHLLSSEPEAVQVDELRQSVEEIEDGQAARDAQTLLSGWADADAATVEAGLQELREQEGAFAHFMLEEVLAARNVRMADRAEEYLRQGGITFFAVGALHLFSEDGLIAELKRRGYAVRNLQ